MSTEPSPVLAKELRNRQPDIEILVVGEDPAPPHSTKAPEILRWIEREGYILISSNRSTMPPHLRDRLDAGGISPAFYYCAPSDR